MCLVNNAVKPYDDGQDHLGKYSFQKSFTMYEIIRIYRAPFSSSSLGIQDRYNIIFKFVTLLSASYGFRSYKHSRNTMTNSINITFSHVGLVNEIETTYNIWLLSISLHRTTKHAIACRREFFFKIDDR